MAQDRASVIALKEMREHKHGLPTKLPGLRVCLRCDRPFRSFHIIRNRLCRVCREINFSTDDAYAYHVGDPFENDGDDILWMNRSDVSDSVDILPIRDSLRRAALRGGVNGKRTQAVQRSVKKSS